MQRLEHRALRLTSGRKGFSIAEVLIALMLLGVMAVAITGACMFARRSAESAVAENTALTTAQGYMEQIKTFTYASLMASVSDASVPINTMSSLTANDYLYQNAYATKVVVLRRDSGGAAVQSLSVDIMPVLSDASSGTGREIVGIQIFYRWRDPITNQLRTASIRSAKSI